MTDGFMPKCYNNVPIIIDRFPENSHTRALAVDAVRHPNGPRCRSLSHNWLSQLTPQNIAMSGANREKFEWYFGNVTKKRLEAVKEYLSNPKIDFIPKVKNPDPAQLERLKTMNGEIADILRKFTEDTYIPKERVRE